MTINSKSTPPQNKDSFYYYRLLNKKFIQNTPYKNFDVHYEGSNGKQESIVLNLDSEFRSLQIKQSILLNKAKVYRIVMTDKKNKTGYSCNLQENEETTFLENQLYSCEIDIIEIFKNEIEGFISIFDKSHRLENFGGLIECSYIENKKYLKIRVKKHQYFKKIVSRGEINFNNFKDETLLGCYEVLNKIKKENKIPDKYNFFTMSQLQMFFATTSSEDAKILEINFTENSDTAKNLKRFFRLYQKGLSIFKGEIKEDPFQICLDLKNMKNSYYISHELVDEKVERFEGENVFAIYI